MTSNEVSRCSRSFKSHKLCLPIFHRVSNRDNGQKDDSVCSSKQLPYFPATTTQELDFIGIMNKEFQ